jgi:hypothetical protein
MLRLWDFKTFFMRGDQIEPSREHWIDVTPELKKIRSAGLAPVCVLYTHQPWRCRSDRPGVPDLSWPKEPSVAYEDMSPWMQFVNRLTAKYRGYINHWEIWNEPHNPWYWGETKLFPLGKPDASGYVEAVRQAAIVIRKNHAGKVIGGGGGGPSWPYTAQCLESGLAKHCDILSIHYGYCGEDDPSKENAYIEQVRRLKQVTGGLPIWNTEANIGTGPAEPSTLTRLLRVNQRAGVEAVFYYYLDKGSPEHIENMADGKGGLKHWTTAYGEFR